MGEKAIRPDGAGRGRVRSHSITSWGEPRGARKKAARPSPPGVPGPTTTSAWLCPEQGAPGCAGGRASGEDRVVSAIENIWWNTGGTATPPHLPGCSRVGLIRRGRRRTIGACAIHQWNHHPGAQRHEADASTQVCACRTTVYTGSHAQRPAGHYAEDGR